MKKPFWDKGRGDLRILLGVVLIGLLTRLAALPFSMTTEQDAAVRVSLALGWLEDPHWILDGIWLPLQTYYMAIAMGLTQEWVMTPIALNLLFSVMTAIPLYAFTKREFGVDSARAGFVATAFVLYPIAFRNSLMAMSDTPFTFLVVVSLWALSRAKQANSSESYAIVAGIAMMLASALRYEGWVLIPPLALTLWRRPRRMLIFSSLALLTPLIWMAGNGVMRGDWFYSLKYQVEDTATNLAQRGGMSPLKRFVRAIFMPSMLALGMTPPLFGLGLWGALKSLVQRSAARIWLLPLVCLFGLFCYKSVCGTMNLQPRYSMVLGTLLMPFSALAFTQIRSTRLRRGLGAGVLLLMLPLSYITHLTRPFLHWALADTQMVKRETPASLLEAIPRLAPSTQTVVRQVKQHLQPRDALFITDLPEIGYLVLYPLGLPLSQVEILPNGMQAPRTQHQASQFLRRQPQGLLLASAKTILRVQPTALRPVSHRPGQRQDFPDYAFPWQLTPEIWVRLQPLESAKDVVLYRYEVLNP